MSESTAPASSTTGSNIDQPRDHDFDGIVEYDNDLPRWWLIMFHLSAVFAIIYGLHVHWGPGLIGVARLNAENARYAALAPPDAGPLTEEALRALSTLPERAAKSRRCTANRPASPAIIRRPPV